MPELIDQGVKVDMILCDLPYGTTACKWDTVIPFEPLWDCYKGLIKDNGAVVLFGSQPFTSALIMSNIKWFKYEWIWDKKKPTGFPNAKLKPLKQHENILIFSNGVTANGSMRNMTYYPQMRKAEQKNIRPINRGSSLSSAVFEKRKNTREAKSDINYNPELRYPYSILKYSGQAAECNNGNRMHPTQKPVPLFEYLIRTYTNEGDLVLDNCAGSGTTAIACMNTNRKYICIEQDDKYFQIMQDRIKNHVIQTELKLTTE